MGTTTILDEYASRVERRIDSTNFIGRLLWYAMSEMRVPHEDFTAMLDDAGISGNRPTRPRDADVFKRICSQVKWVKIPTDDPDIFENYRMVEFRDDTTITRRVVRERVNNAGRKLGFTELFDIIFDRETSDIVMKGLDGFRVRRNTVAHSIQEEVLDQYYTHRGCLNAYAIREWIRQHILGLGATMVRPGGGVYFLKEAFVEVIEGLEAVGAQLAEYTTDPDGKVEFHSLPLIDDRKQREMIQRAFEAETIDSIDALLDEITKLTKSDKQITSDRYANLLGQYQDLMAKTLDYEELLEQKLASTSTRLEIFQKSLLGLRSKVKESDR